MKKLLVKKLVEKSLKELIKTRNKLQKELYNLKIKNSLRSLQQTHVLKILRRNIARINTAVTVKIKK